MLSKRIVAVSQDPKFQKRLTAGLMAAGGTVETVGAVSDLTSNRLEADLYVYHYADPETLEFGNLLAKLKPDVPIIVVIPTADLGRTVDLMRDSRIGNILVAEDLDVSRLSNAATKILYGDVFGLEKFLPWGVRVYSILVSDYQEKSGAIAAISEFAAAMGVRKKYRESIESNLDELLMNALYDAPVDDAGKKVFAEIDVKHRITMKMEQKAVVQYACDGDRFAVSVRDSYGTLTKEVVLKFIDKALRSAHQIDRKEGGAGLGLYMVANSSTEFHVNLYPGVATETICIFDVGTAKLHNRIFGVYFEKIDISGRMAEGGSRPRSLVGGRRSQMGNTPPLVKGLLMAAFFAVAASGYIVYQRTRPLPRGNLVVHTDPPGGMVFLDNVNIGRTPIGPLDLESGLYGVRVEMEGFETWGPQAVRVSPGKEPTPVKVPLVRQRATVMVGSSPPGARVYVNGQDTGKLTPASLESSVGDKLQITLRLPGYHEAGQTVTTPPIGQMQNVQIPLQMMPGYALLATSSEPTGAVLFLNDVEQMPQTDAFVLKAGTYDLAIRLAGHVPYIQRVSIKPGEKRTIHAKLVEGGTLAIRSNVEAKVYVDRHYVGKTPLGNVGLGEGTHLIQLRSAKPFLSHDFKLSIRKGERLDRDLLFGTVEIAAANVVARSSLGPEAREVTELALPVGTHRLSLVNKTTGEKREKDVTIAAGRTFPIDKW